MVAFEDVFCQYEFLSGGMIFVSTWRNQSIEGLIVRIHIEYNTSKIECLYIVFREKYVGMGTTYNMQREWFCATDDCCSWREPAKCDMTFCRHLKGTDRLTSVYTTVEYILWYCYTTSGRRVSRFRLTRNLLDNRDEISIII